MIDWIEVEARPAPRDRLILVTSGWGWRREDLTEPEKIVQPRGVRVAGQGHARTVTTIPARHYKFLKFRGVVALVHWSTEVGDDLVKKYGGAWVDPCRKTCLFEPFRYWAEVNNPLEAEGHPSSAALLVQDTVPDVDAMEAYLPTPEEMQARRFQAILRGG